MRTVTCNPQVTSCLRAEAERHDDDGRLLEILLQKLRRIELSPILAHCDSAPDCGEKPNDDTNSNTSMTTNALIIVLPLSILFCSYG